MYCAYDQSVLLTKLHIMIVLMDGGGGTIIVVEAAPRHRPTQIVSRALTVTREVGARRENVTPRTVHHLLRTNENNAARTMMVCFLYLDCVFTYGVYNYVQYVEITMSLKPQKKECVSLVRVVRMIMALILLSLEVMR